MDMKIIKGEKRICPCCMEEHVVKTVLVMDQATFKNSTSIMRYCISSAN